MFKFNLILLISFVNFILTSACPGCLELDELNFEKTVQKFKTVLVKFDQSFPYGDKHETFAAFSQQINNKTVSGTENPEVLIATVGIKDYGDGENKKLADRYGVKTDAFPVIKLFIEGDLDKPLDFEIGSDQLTINQLFAFVKEHSPVHILAPGCDEKLDKLSDKFMRNEKKRKDILKQAEEFVGKTECEERKQLFKLYPSLMKGIIEKGEDFIKIQSDRMNKLLKDKISKKKQEEINKKLNIIASFKVIKGSDKNEL